MSLKMIYTLYESQLRLAIIVIDMSFVWYSSLAQNLIIFQIFTDWVSIENGKEKV